MSRTVNTRLNYDTEVLELVGISLSQILDMYAACTIIVA